MNPYEETVETLRQFLRWEGYVRCDIPACNCGSWHGRDGLHARWREVKDALAEAGHPLTNANGNTPLRALKELVADRDRLRAALERIAGSRADPHDPAPLTHWAADMQRIARAALAGAESTGSEPPDYRDFWRKYAVPPLARPSCLVCGRADYAWPPAIQHAELPGIVVCHPCRDARAAVPASAPHRIPEANDRSWLCFHCDERFTDREEARQHFGEMRTGVALCQEPRDVQDALRRARDAENRWMDVAAKLGVERTENERLAHMLASWERQFGTTDPREAWNRLDSMEGRALAAEERLSAPPPPAPATEGKP